MLALTYKKTAEYELQTFNSRVNQAKSRTANFLKGQKRVVFLKKPKSRTPRYPRTLSSYSYSNIEVAQSCTVLENVVASLTILT